jgi:hypothetical protein
VSARPAAGGRRERGQHRDVKVTVRYSSAEWDAITEAASRAGMAPAAWLGQAGTDAAAGRGILASRAQRDILAELIRAGGLVRRAGANLNQAVTRLNATGQPGPDLQPAAAWISRVARHVDDAALRISRGLQ